MEERFHNAANYLDKLRTRFQDEPGKIMSFREVMKDYLAVSDGCQKKHMLIDLVARVKAILDGHEDLMLEFNRFLQPWHKISFDDDNDNDDSDEEEDQDSEEEEKEETEEEEEEKTMPAAATEKVDAELYDNVINFFKNVRVILGEEVYLDLVLTLQSLKNNSRKSDDDVVFRDVLLMLADAPAELLDQFYRLKPDARSIPLPKHVPECYQDSNRKNNFKAVVLLKADKEQERHAEIVEASGENNDKGINVGQKKGGFVVKGGGGDNSAVEKLAGLGLSFFERVHKSLSCECSYRKLLQLFFYYTNGKIGKAEWETMVAAVVGKHANLMEEFNSYVRECGKVCALAGKGGGQDKVQKLEERDRKRGKHDYKSIQDLDQSKLPKVTPSYRLIPRYFIDNPFENQGTKKHKSEVLNDHVLSVPVGTEDYSSKAKQKNRHEKIMFRVQDDRLEMDMLLAWFVSAVDYAEELEKGTNEENITKGNKIHFLRCVERLYGDYGYEMLDNFNNDPQHVLPVLKDRLKQKLEELKDWHDELKTLWNDVQARNYLR